jgi:branched-chain amino acid transport system substrate-binding protein
MSMNRSRNWIAGAIVATIAAGCAGGDTGDEEPITIGVLYSQSGSGQVYGVPSLLGHNMAVDKINAAGGILGRQVETVLLDDASDGETAGSLARDLITRDGVDFLIGGLAGLALILAGVALGSGKVRLWRTAAR